MKPVIRVQRVIGIVVLVAASAVAQVGRPVTAAARQQNNAARHRWQTTGRSLPGASSAALRHNALQQKSRMRALRNLSAPTGGISGAWISLGLCHCHPTRAELACRITTGFQAVLRVLRSIPTMSPGIPYMPEARIAACGNPLTPGI